MADGIEFSLIGIDPLIEKLEMVTKDLKKKGGRAALRKAAAVVVKEARQNAKRLDDPETGRSIAKNIAARWNGKVFKKTGDIAFRIGVLHGAKLIDHPDKSKNAPTPHWRLLEFGTEKMPAHPFMRPAIESTTDKVVSTFLTEYEKALDKALAGPTGGGST